MNLDKTSRVEGIPWLIYLARTDPNRALFKASALRIGTDSIPSLIARIQSTTNPLTLWAIHLDLDKRGVPPCMRWPARQDHPQMMYITWLADILWLCKRSPGHATSYARWGGLFKHLPLCDSWHKTAIWVYGSRAAGVFGQGHYFARGLGLADDQREGLITMPTNKMRANRKLLALLPDFELKMTEHASTRPDKSGAWSITEVVQRRLAILKSYLLANRNKTRGCAFYELIHGVKVARQTYIRQLGHVQFATGKAWL